MTTQGNRLLTWGVVCERLGCSPSRAWDLRKEDADFPRPAYILGGGPRWLEDELDRYIELVRARRDGAAPTPEIPAHLRARRERRRAQVEALKAAGRKAAPQPPTEAA